MSADVPPISIAVRAYVLSSERLRQRRPRTFLPRPDAMLVWDTETRIDVTQRLTFGSYRFINNGECLREALFSADDLIRAERDTLSRYIAKQAADVSASGVARLDVLSRSDLIKKFFQLAYKGRLLVVGFNLPFDLSRIAYDVTPARRKFAGGFSLRVWSYRDAADVQQRHLFRPHIAIKHLDSKRALIGFTGRSGADEEDLIPEGSETGELDEHFRFRGHFLDLRTLAFALTDRAHSLESACKAFEVAHPKKPTAHHGTITPAYITYNRFDVLATSELATKLLEEYDRHPIQLPVTQAFSPASIGKAYLRAMGIPPILQRNPKFSAVFLGHAQSAFFGGRTSTRIRKVAVPVVYTDFLSMYPTVNTLMGLWRFVIANRIDVANHCTTEVIELLQEVQRNPNACFDKTMWPRLTAFVRIVPDGDVLPMRAKFSADHNDWQVGVNHLYGAEPPNDSLWFALPDVVSSVLLTGRIPNVVDAFRLEARGKLSTLTPTKLRGMVSVDPTHEDFFKAVIEQRKGLDRRRDLTPIEKKRLDKALKVLANSTSYGIFAEMRRQESSRQRLVRCQSIDAKPFRCSVAHADVPGEYCFPPLASLITAAARLMLALLEQQVTTFGGTYAMEDTDSMAIVASKSGGLVPCPGGRYRLDDGREAVKAMSWADVQLISDAFRTLNPYNPAVVSSSVLEIEKDNFDLDTGKQRQLWCVAISAKRYVLFLKDSRGQPILLREEVNNGDDRWSEHGLGHLVNPTDPESEDREWIAQVWLNIASRTLGLPTRDFGFERRPAVGRIAVTSPPLLRPFTALNEGKGYSEQVKPFNFLSTCHVRRFGHPDRMRPERFQLIAPYEPNPRRWLKMLWIDRYSGRTFAITTKGHYGGPAIARVQTYGEVIQSYEHHPEAKFAGAKGQPCGRETVGLLRRRHVRIGLLTNIGKESNSLEEVQAGIEHEESDVYTEYRDPRRSRWNTIVLPAVKKAPLVTLERMCKGRLSRRALIDIRAGRSTPHRRNQQLLEDLVRRLGIL
jgi:hypothetical protein